MKGLIDRVSLPRFAFHFRENSVLWDKLLKGRSARLIVTMNTPAWYCILILRDPGHNSMKKGNLGFCGVKPVRITTLRPIKSSGESKRKKRLAKIEKLGCRKSKTELGRTVCITLESEDSDNHKCEYCFEDYEKKG